MTVLFSIYIFVENMQQHSTKLQNYVKKIIYLKLSTDFKRIVQ